MCHVLRSVLRAALPDRGFTAHVIGYTVTAVLEALVAAGGVTPGDLDGAIEHVLPLLEADLFGQVNSVLYLLRCTMKSAKLLVLRG